MSKRTPGPWIVTTDWCSRDHWEVIEAEIFPGKWGAVCDTLNRHHCLSPDDSAANAALIADAPAMYALLQKIVAFNETDSLIDQVDDVRLREERAAAYAEAEALLARHQS